MHQTAYEVRISDWSSDVCSSDLHLPRNAVELVDGLNHVHRNTDGARLIGNRTGDRLPDPPGGVGRELVTTAVFELADRLHQADRSEEHTSELQSLMRISYAVLCLKKKTHISITQTKTPYRV